MKLEKIVKIDGITYNNEYERTFITMFGDFTREEYEILKNIFLNDKQKIILEIEDPILDETERKWCY